MSQVKTVTLRTDDDSVNLDALVEKLAIDNGLSVTTWKKKGKHSKKEAVEAESEAAVA